MLSASYALFYLVFTTLLHTIINISLSIIIKTLFVILHIHIAFQAKTNKDYPNYFKNYLMLLKIMLATEYQGPRFYFDIFS